jgi:crotonobetainyl-CoA:carnitine CoA-transferase CaiB-like acyl-CoA transferase
MPGALEDLVVLELATGVAGPYCGRLLADLGAQVVKVEPLAGDPVRAEVPLLGGESAFFNYINAGKLGVAAPLDAPVLDGPIAHAGIILHSERGAGADALEERLRAANPGAVVVSLSPYGRSGERSTWQASALTEWATGGYHYIAGDPQREPLSLPGYQAEFHAGVHAGIAALAGLWYARNTGQGQRIEISHQEATLNDHAWLTTMWTHQGNVQRRTGSAYIPCKDGFVYLFNLAAYPNLFVLMERFDLLADESLQQPMNWVVRFPEVVAALTAWAATRTKQEIYHAAQELRIAVSPVNSMADVAASAQLAAREWFGEVQVAGARYTAPGFPYRLSETPCETTGIAPKLGEHTAVVFAPGFAWRKPPAPAAPAMPTAGTADGPLAGLRVIEVTANWAGPIGGRHFADLGADVIKVELATKPATRALIYPGDDLWPEHYHRAGYFNKLNRNKRAICLNLSDPAGREVFLKLVAKADCVLENNAARVMTQLGVGYESLREVNPGIIMCSMSGYGSTGPDRNYSAYGSNIETASGLASLLGYHEGEFFGTGSFYADPVTGNHGAVAMLAALHARRRTGRGQWIDMALLEAVGPFFAQQFLDYTVAGEVPVPHANRWAPVPQDVVPTAGADCWLAVTLRDADDVQRVAAVINTTAGERWAAQWPDSGSEAVDAIAAWAATRDHTSAASALQAAGIAAAPVMANWELYTDNHLNDRGYFVPVRHPRAGTHGQPGFAWRFERTPARIRRPAPLFAEDNDTVFSELAGLSAAEVAGLYEAGITSDHPIYATGPSL